jgi:TonB family protein
MTRLVNALITLIVALLFVLPARSSVDDGRRVAAKSFAKEIEQAQLHKIYVADFLDPSGVRNEKGCLFASVFSTNLAKEAHNFEVVNRIESQKQLNELHISPQELQQSEWPSKAVPVLGIDAILVGSITASPTDVRLLLSLRNAVTGKEIHSMNYHEQLQPTFESSFPAVQAEADGVFYFPGLDGISQPKCIHCPDPPYTDEARRRRIQGTILISARIDEAGTITNARVVKSPNDGLAEQAINILTKWRMKPSYDLNGKAVAVRVSIEVSFRMLR